MRRMAIATMLAAALLTGSPLMVPAEAAAQRIIQMQDKGGADDMPPLRPVVVTSGRKPLTFLAGAVGAAVGVVVVDAIVGGLLLTPLGLPSGAAILGLAGGAAAEAPAAVAAAAPAAAGPVAPAAAVRAAAAVAAPSFTLAERLIAVVGTIASGVGGGYLGAYLARPAPDFVGLNE